MKGPHSYTRDGNLIYVRGIDYGPRVEVIAERGERMLWCAPGHSVWGGRGMPSKHYGTVYLAVEVTGDGACNVVREEQPGRKWKPIVEEMAAWINQR